MINYVEKKRSSLVQQYLRLELEKEPNVSSLDDPFSGGAPRDLYHFMRSHTMNSMV
jgi:hypothetical protein